MEPDNPESDTDPPEAEVENPSPRTTGAKERYPQSSHKPKKLASRSGLSVVLQFTEVFFQFAILLVLTRGFGGEVFGHYIYAVTLITFLVMFGRLGFDVSSVRFLSTYLIENRHSLLRGYLKFSNRTVLLLTCGITVLFVIVVQLMAKSIPPELLHCLLAASPLIVLLALLQVYGGVLRGFDMSLRSRIPQTVVLPVSLLTGAALVLWFCPAEQRTAWPIAVVHVLAAAIAAAIAARWIQVSLQPETRSATPEFDSRKWLVSGGLLVLLAGMSKLQAQVDILMLGAIRGTTEAGVYAIASRIAGVPVLVLVASNMVISPLCARLLRKQAHAAIVRLIRHSGMIVVGLSLPLALGLAVFGDGALGLLGEDFTSGYVPLLILLVGQFGFILSGPAGVLLNMSGNEAVMAKILTGGVALNIILNAVLIALYGSNGAAIATSISTILCRAALAGAVQKKLGLPCSLIQPRTWFGSAGR